MNSSQKPFFIAAVVAVVAFSLGAVGGESQAKIVNVPGPVVYTTLPAPSPITLPAVTVTVTPAVCVTALTELSDLLGAENNMLMAAGNNDQAAFNKAQAAFVALGANAPTKAFADATTCRSLENAGS